MSRRMTKTTMDLSDNDEMLPSTNTVPKSSDKANPTANTANSMGFSLQKSFEANAFKTVNGQFQLQGRHGIAILATADKSLFKLLIYASGNAVISQAILTHNFQLTISNKVYASFYDSYNMGWSLLFDTEERLIEFARYICFIKFILGKYSTVTWCDFIPGDGDKIEMGDSAEIRFTGYVLQENGSLGNVFETNKAPNTKPIKLKIGKSKTIEGWNEGLIGIQKGTHRMLIIPSSKAYGSKGLPPKVPPNSNLYFDVEASRIRSRRESNVASLNSQSTGLKDIPQNPRSMSMSLKTESGDDDDIALPSIPIVSSDVNQRGRSSSQKSSKQAILSRMARMGQAMLPPSGSGGKDSDSDAAGSDKSEISDSVVQMSAYQPTQPITESTHRVQHIPVIPNQQTAILNPQSVASPPGGSQQEVMYQQQQVFPSQSIYQVVNQPSNQLATYTSMRPPQVQGAQFIGGSATLQQPQGPAQVEQIPMNYQQHQQQQQGDRQSNRKENDLPDLHSAMLVNETRQQNTEMRISIGKLQDRLDDVLTIVREMKNNDKNSSSLIPTVPTMETSVLLQNLTRIVKENEHLKNEVFQKSEKIESQSKKISDLLAKNQIFIEENNQNLEKNALTLHSNASSTHQKILSLEEQKLKLVQELSARTSEIYELQLALDKARKDVSESTHNLSESIDKRDSLQKSVESLKIGNRELEDKIESLKSYNKDIKDSARSLEQKVENLEEKNKELQQEHASTQKTFKEKLSKLEDEKRELTHHFDREKTELSREIDELREKLRQERAAVYSDVSLKQNQIEEEITTRWKKRCDKLVRAEVERFERQIAELNEDKERVEKDYETALKKLSIFKNQTREMKQNLLDEIQRITSENETLTEKIDELEASKQKSKEIVQTGEDLNFKIKSIMNNVFHSVKSKIQADKKYDGSKIHMVVMEIIRKTTLSLTAEVSDEESEEEDEDEGDEEEEEEEEQNDSEPEDISSESIPNVNTESIISNDTRNPIQNVQDAWVNDSNKDVGDHSSDKLKCPVEDMNTNNQITPGGGDESSSPDNTSDLISTMHDEFPEADTSSNQDIVAGETHSTMVSPIPITHIANECSKEPNYVDEKIGEPNEKIDENFPLVNESGNSNNVHTAAKQIEHSVQNDEIDTSTMDSSEISSDDKLKSEDEQNKNLDNKSIPDQEQNNEPTEKKEVFDKPKDEEVMELIASSDSHDNELESTPAAGSSETAQENISPSKSKPEDSKPNNLNESSAVKPKSNDAYSSLFSDDEDNEGDTIFAIPKKETKKEPIETAQVKVPVKSLFGDDDDDIGWLNS